MTRPDLPTTPVVAWRESHTPWWAWPIMALALDGIEVQREVTVSENGLLIGGTGRRPASRFVAWDEIAAITEAPDPDLATVRLRDGDDLLLDRWHLPVPAGAAVRQERVELLQRALGTSRSSTT